MLSIRTFWLYAALLICVVFALIAYAIYSSSEKNVNLGSSVNAALDGGSVSSENNVSNISTTSSQEKKENTPFNESVPNHLPAPAKKLHKVITTSNLASSDDSESLEQKTQELDQRLAELNQQLQDKGIVVPENQKNNSISQSETQDRLDAIKNHIENKSNQ